MSKGRVWNKGKHNGGKGGPLKGKSSKVEAADKSKQIAPPEEKSPTEAGGVVVESRIDRVGRMNRDHWVSRPARVTSEKPGNETE
jgi:hypothetical protein